jgi:hypothetical protein
VQLFVFWDDPKMDAILLIIGIVYERNIFDMKQEFMFIWTNLNVIFIQIKKKLHPSGHYIFSIKFEVFFFFTNKNIPIVVCPFSFGHCVVSSSSIYGFWLPLWYLQTLLWTVTTFCQVQKDQTNVHNSGILCINFLFKLKKKVASFRSLYFFY